MLIPSVPAADRMSQPPERLQRKGEVDTVDTMLAWFQKLTPKNRLETPLLWRLRLLLPATVFVAMAWAGFSQPASATVFQITVDVNFGEVDASGDVLYTIDDGGTAGSVMLIFDTEGLDATVGEKITQWYVNYEGTIAIGDLVFTYDSGASDGPEADSVDVGIDSKQADGDGKFDIVFQFATSGDDAALFQADEIVKYNVTGTDITAFDFFHVSATGGGQGTFCTAMKIQSTGLDNEGSDWVGGNCVPGGMEMPEPSTLALFGFGLVGLRVMMRRRRRKADAA